jgi:hypothetical protein
MAPSPPLAIAVTHLCHWQLAASALGVRFGWHGQLYSDARAVSRQYNALMGRLFRILLTTTSVMSLLLCIITTIYWVRSKLLISDQLIHHSPRPSENTDAEISLQSLDGAIALRWNTYPTLHTVQIGRSPRVQIRSDPLEGLYYFTQHYPPDSISYDSFWKRLGFHFGLPAPQRFEAGILAVPHWFLLLVFSLLPLLRLRADLRSYHRRRLGLCPTCGYDLRASPDKCPECGASPQGAAI